jgi:hypothetical protein
MIINPAGAGETLVRDADVDRVLGGDRSAASALSFRQRAEWGARWVVVHVAETGRLAGTIPGRAGRRAIPMWTDLESAEAALPAGARVVQSALIDLLAGGDQVDYAIAPQSPGLYIDQTLRAELLETEPLFPKGYWAQLGILKPDDHAPFLAAAALAAAEARGAGRPFAGLWVVGYQLEAAPARVVYVVDADDLDAAAAIVVDAINRQEPQRERTETVRLRDLSPESQEFVRMSPDLAGS